jgi:hypothetical protein
MRRLVRRFSIAKEEPDSILRNVRVEVAAVDGRKLKANPCLRFSSPAVVMSPQVLDQDGTRETIFIGLLTGDIGRDDKIFIGFEPDHMEIAATLPEVA